MKIVIFGANEIGCAIATEFFEDHDITVIDKEENRSEDFNKLDISFVYGNASNLSVLENAEIKKADVFIACTNLDEANIVSCLTVKSICQAECVCFVSKYEYVESLNLTQQQNGIKSIDFIIWPEELLTQEIFRIITIPQAIDVENFAHGKVRLTEYRIKENSKILNKKVKDIKFPYETLVVGITKDEKLFIPNGETVFEKDDKAIFMGTAYSLDFLANEFFDDSEKIDFVTIIGGGNVGMMLAQSLEDIGIKVKIIEVDHKRCEFLSQNLKKSLILNSDGTDIDLLKQEEIEDSDVVISVTNNDEKNLLCSLLTKQLGVPRVIARVSKTVNAKLFEKVGIDIALSPREAAINEIKNVVIEPTVDILAFVERGQGKILEISLDSNFNEIFLKDLKMPKEALITVIQRKGKIIIPTGQTKLLPYDKIIIFTTQENATSIKKFFNR